MKLKTMAVATATLLFIVATQARAETATEVSINIVAMNYADMFDISTRCKIPIPPSVKTSIITTLLTIPDIDISSMELKIDAFAESKVSRGSHCYSSDPGEFKRLLNMMPTHIDGLKQSISREN